MASVQGIVRRGCGAFLVFVVAASTAASCAPTPASGEEVDVVLRNLYGESSTFWAGSPPIINVCWEPTTWTNPSFANHRTWIEDTVRRSWVRFARVNFVGWQQCSAGQAGVHALVNPGTPCAGQNNAGIGTSFNNKDNGLAVGDCAPAANCYAGMPGLGCPGQGQECCVKKIALHEFGHALGFYHEEERPDLYPPQDCNGSTAPFQNGEYYGAFNSLSPMSECGGISNPAFWTQGLYAGDIAAIQRAYDRRIRGSLVSVNGRCVASYGNAPGDEGFTWDCDEFQDDQEWRYNVSSQKLTVANNSSLCLGVQAAQNSPVKLINCADNGQGITWTFRNAYIRGYGQCLDLAGGNTNGGGLQSWDCGALNGANQKWRLTPDHEIRFGTTAACITVPGNGVGQVTVTPCTGSITQKFLFANAAQQIGSQLFSSKCLDVQSVLDSQYFNSTNGSGLPINGAPVRLYDCLGTQYNQKWNFSGEVFNNLRQRCLQRAHASNGASLSVQFCNGSESQQWDYYPL